MGGTDDSSNLVELTIEEHAEAHRVLYEKHNKLEDYLAWQGLSGQIGKEEILKEVCSMKGERNPMFGKTGENSPIYGLKRTQEIKDKISKSLKSYSKNRKKSHDRNLRLSLYNENTNKKRVNNIARSWKITFEDNTHTTIHNLAAWCRENNISKSSICCAYKDKRSYKGMFFEKV